MAKTQKAQASDAPLAKPFVAKTYELVNNPATDKLIYWSEDGDSFIITNTDEFERDLLPKHFNCNFGSFTRQLNTYGFRKMPTIFSEWQHRLFKRGEKHRLVEIHRRKSSRKKQKSSLKKRVRNIRAVSAVQAAISSDAVVVSSISPPRDVALSDADIERDNKRLRKENAAIRQELQRLKSMFGNVAGLMKDLAGDEPVNAAPVESEGGGAAEESVPRLYGVEIDLNRAWVGAPVDAARGADVNPERGLDA